MPNRDGHQDELKSLPRGVENTSHRSDAVYKTAMEILANVSKIIENRSLEGPRILENRCLEGSSNSFWHVWRDVVRILSKVGYQMCEVTANMAPSWAPDAP